MDKASIAKRLLVHYFRLIAEASGVNWTPDNEAEIADIVELIIHAAREEVANNGY